MQKTHEQNCPLCNSPSEFEFCDHKNRKHFFCNTCTEFQISLDAERFLAASDPERRSSLSETAKRSNGTDILVITKTSPQQQEGVAYEPLKAEFVLKSELRS